MRSAADIKRTEKRVKFSRYTACVCTLLSLSELCGEIYGVEISTLEKSFVGRFMGRALAVYVTYLCGFKNVEYTERKYHQTHTAWIFLASP